MKFRAATALAPLSFFSSSRRKNRPFPLREEVNFIGVYLSVVVGARSSLPILWMNARLIHSATSRSADLANSEETTTI